MVKVAWKVINGYGPYAYLQESVKNDGKVTSKHIAYLGAMGKNGLIPGKNLTVPPSGNFEGARLMVPFVGEETAQDLKPSILAVVDALKSQVEAGVAKKDIVVPAKGSTASTKAAKAAPQKKDKSAKKGKGKVAPNQQASAAPTPEAEVAPNNDLLITPLAQGAIDQGYLSQQNVKALQDSAATGGVEALKTTAETLADKEENGMKEENGLKKVAIWNAAADFKTQLEKGAPAGVAPIDQGPPAAPFVEDVSTPTTAPELPPHHSSGLKVPTVNGKPMVSAANAKKLEKAAATGDPKQLADAMVQAAEKMTKVKNQGPIYQTANELFVQMQGLESTDSLPDGEAGQEVQELDFKMGAPPKIKEPSPLLSQQWIGALEDAAKDGNSSKLQNLTNNLIASTWMPGGSQAKLHEAMRNAQKQLKEQIDDEIMANAVAGGNPTVAYIPVTSAGNEPLVTTAESQQLESAAATGDKDLIDATAKLLAAKHAVGNYQKGKAILEVGNSLGDQVKAISEEGAGLQPSPGPASDLAAASIGAGDQVAPNNQDLAVGPQTGAAASDWKLLEGPKGSTPGGLYEDQQGNKAYIKVPQSQQHVRNELLAQDLYKLAGVDVLESGETELQGKPAIASDWSEGFTGSGVNPKGLPGTKEGFVADAWLANWDSVGVGSSKYDNILNLDGKDVRVDVGGSLLFRATGGPKGDKFGNVVTEIEGLRDPSLNPVAATVYGDMTPEEINASAQAVVGISDNAIEEAVKVRFPDDSGLASELAEKLIARRNYVSEWVEKSSQPTAQAVSDASGDAGEAVAPNTPSADAGFDPAAQAVSEAALGTEVAPNIASVDAAPELPADGPPKVTTDIPLAYYTGKPPIHPTHVKKMETAAALGDIKLLQQTMQDAKGKNPGYNKEQVVSEAAQSLLDQMVAKAQASAPAAAQEAAPPPLQLAPKSPEEILTFEGEVMLNEAAVKALEEAAATGSWDKLNEAAAAIPKPGTTWKENYGHNNVLQNAKDVLTQQVKAAKQEAANSYALSLDKPKIVGELTYDQQVNPLPENQAVLLEKAAATGDKALVEALARIFQGQHSSFSKEAKGLNAARDSLLNQMATLANANYQTIPAGDLGLPTPTTGAGVASWIPTDKFGKPLLSSANAKKLEKAAASGEVKELSAVMMEAADKIAVVPKKQALYKAGIALLEQMQAGKAHQAAAEAPEGLEMDQPTWRPVVSPKVPEYIKNQYSDFDLPGTMVKQLEAAAATGNTKKLEEVADDLIEQSGDFSEKSAIVKAKGTLKGEIEQAIIDAAIPNAMATGKAKIAVVPKTSNGNPLIQDQHVQQLETVANAGDPGFLSATVALISSEYHYLENKNAIANVEKSLQDQMSAIAAVALASPNSPPQ